MNALNALRGPDPPPKRNALRATISPSPRSAVMAALDRYAPAVHDAVRTGQRVVRQTLREANARPNPFNALAKLAGLDDPLSMVEGPAAAAVGPLRRGAQEGVERAALRFAAPTKEMLSEAGYLYHATNLERAREIAESQLRTHGPSKFTDQYAWPDGGRERRAYFSPKADAVHSFAPEEGQAVVLRTRDAAGRFVREGTGDVFTRKSIPPKDLEILGEGDAWHSLLDAFRE